VLDIEEDTFAFIRERLTESAAEVQASIRDDDPASRAARAKVLDATAGVLSALQTLLRAAEEMVLHRSDRLAAGDSAGSAPRRGNGLADAPPTQPAEPIHLSY
jgi:hypothetical protein